MKRYRWVLGLALAALLMTALLYAPALELPLFSDDLLQVPWAKQGTPARFWQSLGPYGDYRPLHFSLWHLVPGEGAALAFRLHLLNLCWHGLALFLVGLLLLGEERDGPDALTAMLIAAAFPFAFDGVLWASALAYPMSVALVTMALLLHLRARRAGRGLSIAAALLVFLAAFSYEGAVVGGVVLLLAEVVLVRERPFAPQVLGYPALSALAALVIARQAVGEGFRPLWEYLPGNLAAWWEALCFPVAPAARWFGGEGGLLPMVALGVAAMAVLGYAAWRSGTGRWLLFGAGWAVLWGAVPVVTQPFEWTRDPLRVFYPLAVGAAFLWWAGWRALRRRRMAALLALVVGLLPAVLFVRREVAAYRRVGRLIGEVVSATRDPACEGGLLLLNLPGRITLEPARYPLGHEGVIPLPPPTDVEALVRLNGGAAIPIRARAAGWILPPLPYRIEPVGALLGPDDFRAVRCVRRTDFAQDGTMHVAVVGEMGGVAPPRAAAARFDVGVSLLDWRCRREADGRVLLELLWQRAGVLTAQPTVFAHLLGADRAAILAQADGDPLDGLYPFALWREGEIVREVRSFPPSAEGVWIRFGVWEPAGGRRAEVTVGGRRQADGFLWCEVGAAEP